MEFLGARVTFPTYAGTTAWLEHGPFAMWLVRQMVPRCFVELGTHYGYSYFSICEAVAGDKLPTRCLAVDTWLGDEHAGFYDDTVFRTVETVNRQYEKFSTLVRATFVEAVNSIEDGSIDLLHIDGRHYYADVKEDFETWQPKLAESAVVLFHDTMVTDRGFGVHRYWDELARDRLSFNFPHGHGLGVLFWGDAVPKKLQAFAELASDARTRDLVHSYFGMTGAAMIECDRRRRVEATNATLNVDEASLEQRVAACEQELRRHRLAGEALAEQANRVVRNKWWRRTAPLRRADNVLRQWRNRAPKLWPESFSYDP